MSGAFFNRFSDGKQRGLAYPSPFFDIAQTYMPPTIKELFKWCKYYFYTHPIINPVVHKMAEYPITELIYEEVKKADANGKTSDEADEPDELASDAYKNVFEEILDIRTFLVNSGLDYFTYGNCFVSISLPFIRLLTCSNNHVHDIKTLGRKAWEYKESAFILKCPTCEVQCTATVDDKPCRDTNKVALIRWNPENISIRFNETTGVSTYRYTVSESLKKDVRTGQQDAIATTPMEFLNAIKNNADLEFNTENFYHLKRSTLAEQDQGWGKPMIMPAMRDAFYLQVLRKANEAIAMQYIVPLTVLFPQPHGNFDPYRHMNLTRWKDKIEQEIAMWRDDPNYIPIMPVPIGNQTIFGQAKALMVTPEIRAVSEQMVTGMGVPIEFIFGGLSYSGSSVSLRILENHLLRYREAMQRLINFIAKTLRIWLKLPKCKISFRDFKMADDIQQQQLLAQFVLNQKISVKSGLEQLGFQYADEQPRIRAEANFTNELQKDTMLAQAEAQGEANLKMSRYQVQAQLEMQLEQLKQQNLLLQNNPQAAQMLLQMQAAPPEAGGQPPAEGQAAPAQDPATVAQAPSPQAATAQGNMPPPAGPEQTQSHEGAMTPQAGYGVGFGPEMPMDPRLLAMHIAAQLEAIQDPASRLSFEQQLKATMPGLSGMVASAVQRRQGMAMEAPMPTHLPPRRAGGSPV